MKEEAEKNVKARRDGIHQGNKVFKTQQDLCTYELTETEAVYVGSTWVLTRSSPGAESSSRHMSPSLTQKLLLIDNKLQIKSLFSPREATERNKLLLRVGCLPSRRCQQKMDSRAFPLKHFYLTIFILFTLFINIFLLLILSLFKTIQDRYV